MKEVRTDNLRVCARPTAVYQREVPHSKPFEVKYVIQNPISVSAGSGVRSRDTVQRTVQEPTKGIDRDAMHAFAQSNSSDSNRHVNGNGPMRTDRYIQDGVLASADTIRSDPTKHVNVSGEMDTDRYIQDPIHASTRANVSSNSTTLLSLEEVLDLGMVKTKNIVNMPYDTKASGNERVDYIHRDVELQRSLPNYETCTNIGQNIYKPVEVESGYELDRNMPLATVVVNSGLGRGGSSGDEFQSREYKLAPRLVAGSFEGRLGVPMTERMQQMHVGADTQKSRLAKAASQWR
jgi:hypothetical protein